MLQGGGFPTGRDRKEQYAEPAGVDKARKVARKVDQV